MGSLKVNVSGMSVFEYVLFFGEATVMMGDFVSDGDDKREDGKEYGTDGGGVGDGDGEGGGGRGGVSVAGGKYVNCSLRELILVAFATLFQSELK